MKLLLWLVVLLAPLPAECLPLLPRHLLLPRPLLLHLGEELSLRVGGGSPEGMGEKEKRSEEPPLSLDLTFHLLREVLQMARNERLNQQATSNRALMDSFGK
ncbi:hypothetical protein JOQ06_026056 [Pogonophryne albipinna]|uniref:Corticotropin-releasing factor domain-containing protein n=1 Tax=Pogonophryne albipinna TaxID=1090488 RepID=A0AAD6A4Y8_9TELE|nr:hypothetical protein JOQ06_026056 [Pogonophryne albipinna]